MKIRKKSSILIAQEAKQLSRYMSDERSFILVGRRIQGSNIYGNFSLVLHCFMAKKSFTAPRQLTARGEDIKDVQLRHRDLFIASESEQPNMVESPKVHEHSQPPRTLWHLKSNFFSFTISGNDNVSGETSKEIKEKWFSVWRFFATL